MTVGMPVSLKQKTEIADRRRKVASLILRQLTEAEVAKALGVSQQTVSLDLVKLREQWRVEALGNVGERLAKQLAELAEVKRAAWQEKDLGKVLAALAQERDLLGLAAPKKIDLRLILQQFIEEAEALPDADLLADLGYIGPGAPTPAAGP